MPRVLVAAACGACLAMAGCGSHGHPATRAATTTGGSLTPPSRRQTAAPADPTDVAVIRGWSDALRHGDIQRAAAYFAVPSRMVNGTDAAGNPLALLLRTRADVQLANETLPCGAVLVSATQRAGLVDALFRLTERRGRGAGCGSGVGHTARTNFLITHGLIVEWLRAPDEPGDGGSPRAPQQSQSQGVTPVV